ncbi:hypothetical protein Unana1_07034 [Umbelopsis nana]
MVFAPYSRIDNETELLLDSVPQAAEPTHTRDRSLSSPPPRPSFRPANRNRAISDPYFAQPTIWHPFADGVDEDVEDMDTDDQDLLGHPVSRPGIPRKKSSGFGLFKQGVLKAVGIKST